jgi:hypothetical protein
MAKKPAKVGNPSKSKTSLIEQTRNLALARNKARLADLLALVRRRVSEVVEGFYDIGEALREILDHKLYATAGHKSLEALLKAEGMMSFRQASKLIAVVREVPREKALAMGQERAYALVAYTNATPEDDSPARLLAANAPVSKASVREIKAATREARARTRAKRPKTDAEREREKADVALQKALRALLRDAGIGRAEITIGRSDVRVAFSRTVAERAARSR